MIKYSQFSKKLIQSSLSKISVSKSFQIQNESIFKLPTQDYSSLATNKAETVPTKIAEPNKNLVVNPLKHDDFFQVKELVKLEELFQARCHYGHDAGLRCPWMSDFIFGTRIKTDVIDLEKTVPMFQKALNFAAHIAFRRGIILFISRYAQHIPIVERTALEVGEYSHCKQWKNGTFTDSTRRFGSVIRLPDLCIFLHTQDKLNESHLAVKEAAQMLIPTIGICDTDVDPSQITYPIPANDDSITSLQLYCNLFKQAILRGKAKREELEKQG